ncbi:helix-turn-helix domain-containing protein [Alkalihalobacillus hemicellulosilyticus]|uniref:Putative transcriptional regulator n=1 Tax=Halalkalibacter hemicellulosilyticusJCM 9152 TaxID=1236971 RepID=W4QLD2_9BACI|nr:AraC family transcriptional regulator [Halalkalibacter hemicellulosilyticus]GAE32910.1 putative transcriptional regulator [Halalkalibacter hemicellulosilyticusJCM 9152]
MYNPKGNGKQKAIQQVQFIEVEPPSHLSGLVHRFLELKTDTPLADDYLFHALPDSCTYIIFDQLNPEIAGITKLHATSEELNLGKKFHYINIRFLPGVWKGQATYGVVDAPYTGILQLNETNHTLIGLDFTAKQSVLSRLVERLIEEQLVVENPVTEKIFAHIDHIHKVTDMADIAGVSPRQLQRTLRQTTGFAPHDFLKVLRLQQSLDSDSYLSHYADQSHFIRSFRKATGYTPARYAKKFNV